MYTILGYNIKGKIFESTASLVYRGIREADQHPVILKILKADYPSRGELVRYRHEYEITRSLSLKGVIKAYAQEKYGNSLAIVLEDFGGESLKILNSRKKLPIQTVLELAVSLTRTLGTVHGAKIIHKDLNPSNIIYNPHTNQLKLIDFGISSKLAMERPIVKNPETLEGTLAYMSPEQTGRMNRTLDYRTDFYALGATLFELLAGRLPFPTRDPLELVHCHLALQATPLQEVNAEIQTGLSQVVMKLLAKRAEDRYQSALGIIHDLEFCLESLRNPDAETRVTFLPGAHDFSSHFRLPQKLYGREEELESLLGAAKRAASGPGEAVFVSGFSGVGKSALIGELYKGFSSDEEKEGRTKPRFGFFISGKFEQYRRDIPFSAMALAFQDLIRQLLTENEESLANWKIRILEALGPNGQVMTRVIPDLKLLIGDTPPVPILDAAEERNRFTMILQNFITVFCSPEHPLTIFLDDLQWADVPSLNLIQSMTQNSSHLLFIGAYRYNEVEQAHPLLLTVLEMEKQNTPLTIINLPHLKLNNIQEYIAEATARDVADTHELAVLVKNRTNGNPFFMGEFLKTLEREGLLQFETGQKGWVWELTRVQAQDINDNVVELIAGRIQNLPEDTRVLLTKAACLGNILNLETLTMVHGKSAGETAANLWPALELNLLLSIHDEFKFAHDRIQEAAYSLLPEREKISVHLTVGRLLKQASKHIIRDPKIFDIVDHLNIGIALMERQSERYELALLNLSAGRRAQSSTAYEPAMRYYQLGLNLLENASPGATQKKMGRTLKLRTFMAETAYLLGDYAEMEKHIRSALDLKPTALDSVKLYEIRIHAFRARNEPANAILVAREILKKLGLHLPANPTKIQILFSLIKTKIRLAGKSPEYLMNRPPMKDRKSSAIIRILNEMGTSVYLAAPNLFPLIIFKVIRLSLDHGIALETPSGYAAYGMILGSILGDIPGGDRFGRLSLEILKKPGMDRIRPLVSWTYPMGVSHWSRPLEDTFAPLRNVFKLALEAGDLETAGYSSSIYAIGAYTSGADLDTLEKEMAAFNKIVSGLKQQSSLIYLGMTQEVVRNLKYPRKTPYILKGAAYDEDIKRPDHELSGDKSGLLLLYIYKMILAYHFQEYKQALGFTKIPFEYVEAGVGLSMIPLLYFYDSLIRLAIYPEQKKTIQARFRKQIRSNQKKLKKWAHHAPMNQLHRVNLVAAEENRVLGNSRAARDFYETAIQQARENNYLSDEALAWELGGRFYLELNRMEFAPHYIRNAHYAYSRWGADAKVFLLNQTYPEILSSENPPDQRTTTSGAATGALDLATIIKTSRAISGEIKLDSLLRSMMALVIENAGAQKGFFILEKKGKLYLEAQAEMSPRDSSAGAPASGKADFQLPQAIRDESVLPLSLLDYTLRTGKVLLLANAFTDDDFIRSKYVQKHNIASVLCVPVRKQGQVLGLLYMENNLTPGAFTAAHVKLLEILAAQISVSIENARLFGNLEDKVEERTVQLQNALNNVKALKNRQDGDYFLTSRLLEPLYENTATDKRIKSDILLKQYKKFQYQKWQAEIGGDMCACHDLTLRGKTYTLFLNADAMGKSMQGAGGSLVLLAALKALLGKVNASPLLQNQSPEDWLSGAYMELYRIFATFKGSMQVSLIMGLADGENRRLYYFNGEHPQPVLFRQGRAMYIDEEFTVHKLGEAMEDPPFSIKTLDLEVGDMVIMGSDGKDDLEKGVDADGYRVISDNKDVFLDCVMEAKGEPELIMASLLKRGNFIDDFSILRLRVEV